MLKKFKNLQKILFLWSICATSSFGIYQFENGIPENFTTSNTSKLILENNIVKDGKQSLKWQFKKGDKLNIKKDIDYKPFVKKQKEKSRVSYAMWIYNKTPINDKLKVEFKKDNNVKSFFEVNLNFVGWRTMWVQFDRDMQGTPEVGMNNIEFTAPNVDGEIIIDQIIPTILIDPRHNARDEQVNFINIDADNAPNAHWMALYKNYNQIKSNDTVASITTNQIEGLKTIENKLLKDILKNVAVNDQIIAEKNKQLSLYKQMFLTTPQVVEVYDKQLKKENLEKMNFLQLQDFGIFMRELAYMYNSTDNPTYQKQIYDMFIDGLNYMYSQGWTKGSSQGTIHHLGYTIRELYQSILLMKQPLLKNQQLQKAKDMVSWYSALGIIYTPDNEIKGVNIDVLNTMLPGILTAIMLNENPSVAAKQLEVFNHYLTTGIMYCPGLVGGFKDDGSVFHHMQNYPAYAKGAFEGLTPIIYYIGNTPFALDENAFNKVKKSLLMMRIYSNKYNWLLTLSGRHPNGKFKIPVDSFGYAAFGLKNGIDKDLAQAYLRLATKSKFKEISDNYKAENSPNGSWTMNMGSLQLHRRDNWLVGAKGFSRYLVGNETYKKNNLFGRYMSYGTVEILQGSLEKSGFVQEGWDWNHYPGTTAISLPFDKLKSSIAQVDVFSGVEEMLLSDETYSGGNSLNNNGMFAMKLHENPKYNGSHRARKSVFFFDNKVVLIGTNIINNDKQNKTHTTLFQNFLPNKTIKPESKSINNPTVIVDSQNNMYKIKEGNIVYKKGMQNSLDQNVGTPTKNNYELAYINHGTSPENESYEYSILIKGNKKQQEEFKNNNYYNVVQKDYNAHIVEDNISKMRGYALFEPISLKDKYINKVDTPSMVLLQPQKDKIELSFVDPDLRLYEGIDFTQYTKDGAMKEVSIYSRPWNKNDSIAHTSTLIINGKYKVNPNENVKVEYENNNTVLKITTKYATPVKITLSK